MRSKCSSLSSYVHATCAASLITVAILFGRNTQILGRGKGFFLDAPNIQRDARRNLAGQSSSQNVCHICAVSGSKLYSNVLPAWTEAALHVTDGTISKINMTCEEWESFAATKNETPSSSRCLELRDWLQWQCCDGLPPLYKCETAVEKMVLSDKGDHYMKSRVPVTSGASLDVGVRLEISDLSISNHGVNGGSIEAVVGIQLSWIDKRLKWNSSAAGCVSMEIGFDKVWVPELVVASDADEKEAAVLSEPDVKVLADGRVFWSWYGSIWFACTSSFKHFDKRCLIDFLGGNQGGRVRYISHGVAIEDDVSLPEYRLEKDQIAAKNVDQAAMHGLQVQLDLLPARENCSICDISATLQNGEIHIYPTSWLEVYPDTSGWSCRQLESLLSSIDYLDEKCLMGRAYYEEACCDDARSSYNCETDVHDRTVERHNTITPPDPSSQEDDPHFASVDEVDVHIFLDVSHLIELSVKSNSMTMLVSLSLVWYDQRLAWQPFIGGCHRVSYRASHDAEQTEIWVPHIELVNMGIDGTMSLPDAEASVRYDGLVKWRRTGVLMATCDLHGIDTFPFDETGCYLEFGGTRDPLYHRVNYVSSLEYVEYGKRVSDDSWNYQEYKIDTDKTEVTARTEKLSGFENKLIRFYFYISRARNYYIYMFVLLYIIFTLLSFGMFLVDYQLGERLGYGSSVLFVIVAQDITLSDSTPVTQEWLWIYKLSFGSKLFVIAGIVQSIIVLFLYTWDDFGVDKLEEGESSAEERQSFISRDTSSAEERVDVEKSVGVEPSGNNIEANGVSSVADSDNRGELSTASEHTRGFYNCCKRKKAKKILWISRRILQYDLHDDSDSKTQRKLKYLRMVDFTCAIFFTVAYTLFLVVLFALM